jgi:hypothetical protein
LQILQTQRTQSLCDVVTQDLPPGGLGEKPNDAPQCAQVSARKQQAQAQ